MKKTTFDQVANYNWGKKKTFAKRFCEEVDGAMVVLANGLEVTLKLTRLLPMYDEKKRLVLIQAEIDLDCLKKTPDSVLSFVTHCHVTYQLYPGGWMRWIMFKLKWAIKQDVGAFMSARFRESVD